MRQRGSVRPSFGKLDRGRDRDLVGDRCPRDIGPADPSSHRLEPESTCSRGRNRFPPRTPHQAEISHQQIGSGRHRDMEAIHVHRVANPGKFLPSALKRRFTRSAMGPMGAWSPGIHLGYTRSMVCARRRSYGKRFMCGKDLSGDGGCVHVQDDGGCVSWARAAVADNMSPSHNRPGAEDNGGRGSIKERAIRFTPAGFRMPTAAWSPQIQNRMQSVRATPPRRCGEA